MSLSSYYPEVAPGGSYESYGAYRHRMQVDKRYLGALRLLGFLGLDTYESLERAARADARGRIGPFGGTERRADDIYAMSIRDPIHSVEDTAVEWRYAASEILLRHEADGDRLACPHCRRMFERGELAIVVNREESGSPFGVTWGCSDCTGDCARAVTLNRMPNIESAMRWTVHMLQKPHMLHSVAVAGWIASLAGIFGDELRLWREAVL